MEYVGTWIDLQVDFVERVSHRFHDPPEPHVKSHAFLDLVTIPFAFAPDVFALPLALA